MEFRASLSSLLAGSFDPSAPFKHIVAESCWGLVPQHFLSAFLAAVDDAASSKRSRSFELPAIESHLSHGNLKQTN
jgi:hypothetical protein